MLISAAKNIVGNLRPAFNLAFLEQSCTTFHGYQILLRVDHDADMTRRVFHSRHLTGARADMCLESEDMSR